MVDILILEDHPLFLDALGAAVAGGFDARISLATTLEEALACIDGQDIDLVLLDLNIPDSSLFHGLTAIKRKRPNLSVLVISALLCRTVVAEALRLDAAGFIPKSSPVQEITAAIGAVLSGAIYLPEAYKGCEPVHAGEDNHSSLLKVLSELTGRQRRILKLISEGKLNKQIAHELGIAERTVKAHVTGILRKLRVSSRTQAALIGRRLEEFGALD